MLKSKEKPIYRLFNAGDIIRDKDTDAQGVVSDVDRMDVYGTRTYTVHMSDGTNVRGFSNLEMMHRFVKVLEE